MRVITSIKGVRDEIYKSDDPVGFIPTMGALHDGHMALVSRALLENATVVVSIFINPNQFDSNGDFEDYPRDNVSDLGKLKKAGVGIVFTPEVEEMYPNGFDTYVDIGKIGNLLEGKSRREHFKGVSTILCKLLATIRPKRAYFGQKDAQQCLVVKQLNRDLDLGTEIVVVSTVRDSNGLAFSSRNAYLGNDEKRAASVLYRSLVLASDLWRQGERDAKKIRNRMRDLVNTESIALIDYISIADADNLQELDFIDRRALVSLAVQFGKSRLIDNVIIGGLVENTRN